MSILFTISRQNRDFFCKADGGASFFVGRKVPYEDNIGLFNIFGGSRLQKLNFDAADFAGDFGFWAAFVAPTAHCEGRSFLTLNTYDRAAFTFGFGQFAAHVPDGDFVRYLRDLLAMPEAADYFPSLALVQGRIAKVDGAGAPVLLETADSTAKLMKYLNPTLDEVEDQEVIAAAKLIHWTVHHRAAQVAQVKEMVRVFKSFMANADRRKLIDQRPAAQCCVIADILHHGRGGKLTWTLIGDALARPDPLRALLQIGLPKWKERVTTLARAIDADTEMATRHWNTASDDFV